MTEHCELSRTSQCFGTFSKYVCGKHVLCFVHFVPEKVIAKPIFGCNTKGFIDKTEQTVLIFHWTFAGVGTCFASVVAKRSSSGSK